MRAWRIERPGVPQDLRIDEVPVPIPREGEVRVRVASAALNFSDLLMIADRYQVKPPWPLVPGQEVAGVVELAGANTAIAVGTRVATKVLWGGFAEQVVASTKMLIPLPVSIAFDDAATLPVVWPTAWIGLHDRGALAVGETLLVHAAAGGVGLAAVQLGHAHGARVLATVGSADKADVVRAAGAEAVLVARDAAWADEVLRLTDGRGADVIFDPVGGATTELSLKCIARRGRLLVVGFASGAVASIKAHRLLLRNAAALGVYWSHEDDALLVHSALDNLFALHAAGRIALAASRVYPFEALPQALDDLAARRTIGKCVLRASGDSR